MKAGDFMRGFGRAPGWVKALWIIAALAFLFFAFFFLFFVGLGAAAAVAIVVFGAGLIFIFYLLAKRGISEMES